MKKLHLSGSSKEIGRKHGEQGKAEVMQSLETYEKLFYGYSGINWNQAREQALTHIKAIETMHPHFIEEMEGLAEGAGVDFEDILVLNARSEIALANYGHSNKLFADGCTAIGVTPPVSKETIIGQNWDWKASQANSLLLLEIEQTGLPTIKMVTEGGIIGKIGMNSAGIGVCLNALITNKKTDQIPIHLGLRSVLNSYTLDEAIAAIDNGKMASTANFLIGSDAGDGKATAASYEVSPFGVDRLGDGTGSTVHTNHICSTELTKYVEDRNEYRQEDSMVRKSRAEELVGSRIDNQEEINEACFKECFADKYNYPNSINHYSNDQVPEHRRMETVFSIIMNLTRKKMLLCVGKPSENEYEEV